MRLTRAIIGICSIAWTGLAQPFVAHTLSINTNVVYAVTGVDAHNYAVRSLVVFADTPYAATLKIYKASGSGILITNALPAGASNICCAATNTLEVGAHIVVRDTSSERFQRATVHSVAADGIVITNYPGSGLSQMDFALTAGCTLYRMTNVASLKFNAGLTTVRTLAGDTMPVLYEVSQTGLCTNLGLLVGGVVNLK